MPSDPRVSYGVAVAVLVEPTAILLIKRKGSHGAGLWALPGGWVNFGELIRDAVVRELKEELGLTLDRVGLKPFGIDELFFPEVQSLSLYYHARLADDSGPPVIGEPDKISEYQTLDLMRPDTWPPAAEMFPGLHHALMSLAGNAT